MKHTTFYFDTNKNNASNNNINGSINYSKALDDIILSNLKKSTPYIFKDATLGAAFNELESTPKTKSIDIYINSGAKSSKKIPSLIDAINYFKGNTSKLYSAFEYPTFKIGNDYITIYEDEILINNDLIPFDLFGDIDYISGLSDSTKKTIIDIYITIKK